jgi:hypothetical protein
MKEGRNEEDGGSYAPKASGPEEIEKKGRPQPPVLLFM